MVGRRGSRFRSLLRSKTASCQLPYSACPTQQTLTLDIVAHCLGSNDNIVVEHADLSPPGADTLCGQSTKIDHLAVAQDLDKCCASELANNAKFTTTSSVPPTPRRGTLALSGSQIGMVEKIIQVHVVTTESVVRIALFDNGEAIAAANRVISEERVRVQRTILRGVQ